MLPNSLHCEYWDESSQLKKSWTLFWPLVLWGVLLSPVYLMGVVSNVVVRTIFRK